MESVDLKTFKSKVGPDGIARLIRRITKKPPTDPMNYYYQLAHQPGRCSAKRAIEIEAESAKVGKDFGVMVGREQMRPDLFAQATPKKKRAKA